MCTLIDVCLLSPGTISEYTVAVLDTGNWRQIYDDSQTTGVVRFVNITATIRAQSLQIQRNIAYHRLMLCEVEVYGGIYGKYIIKQL